MQVTRIVNLRPHLLVFGKIVYRRRFTLVTRDVEGIRRSVNVRQQALVGALFGKTGDIGLQFLKYFGNGFDPDHIQMEEIVYLPLLPRVGAHMDHTAGLSQVPIRPERPPVQFSQALVSSVASRSAEPLSRLDRGRSHALKYTAPGLSAWGAESPALSWKRWAILFNGDGRKGPFAKHGGKGHEI